MAVILETRFWPQANPLYLTQVDYWCARREVMIWKGPRSEPNEDIVSGTWSPDRSRALVLSDAEGNQLLADLARRERNAGRYKLTPADTR